MNILEIQSLGFQPEEKEPEPEVGPEKIRSLRYIAYTPDTKLYMRINKPPFNCVLAAPTGDVEGNTRYYYAALPEAMLKDFRF